MIIKPNSDIAFFVLRLALGAVLIVHSLYLKLVVFTLGGTAAYFESIGLPATLAYVTFILEAVTGIAFIVGAKTRWFALAIIPILLGATWAHSHNGWLFSNTGGGWEYPLFLVVIAVVLFFTGGGRYSLIEDK